MLPPHPGASWWWTGDSRDVGQINLFFFKSCLSRVLVVRKLTTVTEACVSLLVQGLGKMFAYSWPIVQEVEMQVYTLSHSIGLLFNGIRSMNWGSRLIKHSLCLLTSTGLSPKGWLWTRSDVPNASMLIDKKHWVLAEFPTPSVDRALWSPCVLPCWLVTQLEKFGKKGPQLRKCLHQSGQ